MNLEGMVAKLFPGEDPSSTQFSVHFPRHWSGVPLRFPSTPLPYHRFGVPKMICAGTVKYDVYYTEANLYI